MQWFRISTVAACTALAWCAAIAASGQTLDQEVTRLLTMDCEQLGVQGGNGNGHPGALGPHLDAICRITTGIATGSSTGGGGAQSQTSGAHLGRKRAEGRLEELREGEQGAAKDVLEAIDLFKIEGLGLWASGDYTRRNREVTTFEDGFESDVLGANAGVDYRFADFLVAGVAYNYQNIDGDFTGGGDFDTDAHGVVAYGSLSPLPELFVDGSVGYSWKDYEVNRAATFTEVSGTVVLDRFAGIAASDTNGEEFSTRGVVGYDHTMGGVTIGPRAGVQFVHSDIDGYREHGTTGLELTYEDRTRQSLQSSLGAALSAASSFGFGVLIPTFDFEWIHEFQDDQRHYSARFAEDLRADPTRFRFENERPDRDFFNLNAGVSAVLAHGVQLFAQYRTLLGHGYFDSHGVAVGVRFELGGAR
jgi:outer membrane autotransporter protein